MAALHGPPESDPPWPLPVAMLRALVRGDGERAVREGARCLQRSGVPTPFPLDRLARDQAIRLGVALLMPLSSRARREAWSTVTGAPSDGGLSP